MNSTLVPPFSLGIDTVQPLVGEALSTVIRHRYSFAIRYLWGRYAMTRRESQGILAAGLGLMTVTPSRKPGWLPSAGIGADDAAKTLSALSSLAFPTHTVWLDLEECADSPVTYANAWSYNVVSAGFEAGLYVGAGAVLDAGELYRLPYITRYWRSCSRVPEPAVRGFCMSQLRPGNARISNVVVDVNVIERDFKGDLPQMVVA